MKSEPRAQEEILSLTKTLMGFKTTDENPDEIKRCIDFIESYLHRTGVVIQRHNINHKPSLIITFEKTKKPELFLVGHIDVVPAPKQLFTPIVKGNLLKGRGGYDDKSAVAIMLVLAKQYSQEEHKPDLGLMIVSDEEIGSHDGVKYLTARYSCRFAIVLDGGGEDSIVVKEKGPLHLRIKAKGKTAHGSTPEEGENALDKLIELYLQLRKRFPAAGKWSNTLSLGTLHGGTTVNQVPDSAEIGLDMRFISDKAKLETLRYIRSFKGLKIEIVSDGPVMDTNTNNSYIKALRNSASRVLSKKPHFDRMAGATDARFFSDRKIPSVLMMPKGDGAHALDEHVEINSFGRLYMILREFIDTKIRKSS